MIDACFFAPRSAAQRVFALALKLPNVSRRVAAFHDTVSLPDSAVADAFMGCPCEDEVMERLAAAGTHIEEPGSDNSW